MGAFTRVFVVEVAHLAKHRNRVLVAALELTGLDQRQVCLHARAHDGRRQRLHDVVHRPHLEAPGFVPGFGQARDEDHWRVSGRGIGLESLADLEAIEVRHLHVKKDE